MVNALSSDIKSRAYQIDAVPKLRSAVIDHGSVVYVLPTGGGKTHVAGMLARLAARKDNSVMFLVHRRELVTQALDTLRRSVPGMSIGVEANGWPSMPWAMLQVGMVQSIVRRPHVLSRSPKMIIVDECHHARAATWAKVLQAWPEATRVGLTATPERLDGQGLGEFFAHMVEGPTIPELVDDGYLAPMHVQRLPLDVKMTGFKRNRRGEIAKPEQARAVTGRTVAAAAAAYCKYAPGRRAIFFGINRAHSERVCEDLRARGVAASHVDGDDHTARRDRVMRSFATGGINVLGNCDLVSEGLDVPECDCVILGAPTTSVTRYLQAAGRGRRPMPGKIALLLDLVGISHDLGLPDDVREWSLEDGLVDDKREGIPKPKTCQKCFKSFRGPKCPYCGYAVPREELDQVEVELEEAKTRPKGPKLSRGELYEKVRQARRSEDPEAALVAIAKAQGYKRGWVRIMMSLGGGGGSKPQA